MNSISNNNDCCCSAMVGTKIFAFINLGLTILGFLAAIGVLFASLIENPHMYYSYYGTYYLIALTIVIILIIIAIVFAGFLVAGAVKKNPQYIQAYFIYGIIVTLLSSSAAFYFLFPIEYEPICIFAASFLVICALYALVLVMIRKTYLHYECGKNFESKLLKNDDA